MGRSNNDSAPREIGNKRNEVRFPILNTGNLFLNVPFVQSGRELKELDD